MRHVLEHCLDPLQILKRLAGVLKDGGVLYVAVPDMMNPKGSLNKYWFRAVHTYYFSKPTLLSLTGKAGLEPLVVNTEDHELWGFFRKKDCLDDFNEQGLGKDFFKKQVHVIRKHKKLNNIVALYVFLKNIILKIIPNRIKLYMYRNIKPRF